MSSRSHPGSHWADRQRRHRDVFADEFGTPDRSAFAEALATAAGDSRAERVADEQRRRQRAEDRKDAAVDALTRMFDAADTDNNHTSPEGTHQ